MARLGMIFCLTCARLFSQNDGSGHRLACRLFKTTFRKDDIPKAGGMICRTQSRVRRIHLALFLRCVEVLV